MTKTARPYRHTLLYESKGAEAVKEKELLLELLEELENGDNVRTEEKFDKIFGSNGVQKKFGSANSFGGPSDSRSGGGNGGVLQRTSPEFIGSPAFRSVLQNLFEISDSGRGRDGGDGGEIILSRSEQNKII